MFIKPVNEFEFCSAFVFPVYQQIEYMSQVIKPFRPFAGFSVQSTVISQIAVHYFKIMFQPIARLLSHHLPGAEVCDLQSSKGHLRFHWWWLYREDRLPGRAGGSRIQRVIPTDIRRPAGRSRSDPLRYWPGEAIDRVRLLTRWGYWPGCCRYSPAMTFL